MVPHSVVTVSLATAILPALSAHARRRRPHRRWRARWRARCARRWSWSCPFVALLPVIAPDLAQVVFGHGAAADGDVDELRAVALAVRPRHGLLHRPLPDAARVLRARADPHRLLHPVRWSRPPTSWPRWCWSARPTAEHTSPALVGRLRRVVRRRLGRLLPAAAAAGSAGCAAAGCWSSAAGWLIATGLATGLTFPVAQVLRRTWPTIPALVVAAVRLVAVGAVDVLLFLVFARLLRIERGQPGGRHADPTISRLNRPTMGDLGRLWRPEGSTVPHATRAGDVLADRYRLVDLLSESGGGRFWRAHDRILERHVALHVIAADDERAELLLDAARRSATVLDPRILRVLDAERTERHAASSSTSGAPARRSTSCSRATARSRRDEGRGWSARWPTRSRPRTRTASPHGLLSPENVLVDNAGSVRIIGFCVDAALHGLPPGDPQHDVRRPGRAAARDPDRPLGRRLAVRRTPRAREARPGAAAAAGAGRRTPRPGRPVRRAAQPARAEGPRRPRPRQRPRHPELPDRLRRRPDRAGPGDRGRQPGEERDRRAARRPRDPGPAAPGRLGAAARARRAGRPEPSPSRSPSSTRSPSCPPRPACRSSTTRPTTSPGCGPATSRRHRHRRSRSHRSGRCSPTEAREAPLRRARTPGRWWRAATSTGRSTTSARPAAGVPVVDELTDTREQVPGRNWLRLAMLVALVLVLLVAVAIAFNLGRGKTPLGAEPDTTSPAPRRSPTVTTPAAVADADHRPAGGRLRPAGRRRGEPRRRRRRRRRRPDHVVVDVDLQAAARTRRAQARRRSGGRPRRVPRRTPGRPHPRRRADRASRSTCTDDVPTNPEELTPVAEVQADGAAASVDLDDAPTGRYLTLWFTVPPG